MTLEQKRLVLDVLRYVKVKLREEYELLKKAGFPCSNNGMCYIVKEAFRKGLFKKHNKNLVLGYLDANAPAHVETTSNPRVKELLFIRSFWWSIYNEEGYHKRMEWLDAHIKSLKDACN